MNDVKVGDWIVSLTDKMDFTRGKRYKVYRVDSDLSAWVTDDDGDDYFLYNHQYELTQNQNIEEIKLPREFHIEYSGEKIHVVEVLKS